MYMYVLLYGAHTNLTIIANTFINRPVESQYSFQECSQSTALYILTIAKEMYVEVCI